MNRVVVLTVAFALFCVPANLRADVIFDYQWTVSPQSEEYVHFLTPPKVCLSKSETRRLVRGAADRMVKRLWDEGNVVSYSDPEGFVDDVLENLKKYYSFCWE
ncbi:MAG: hypothetical protein Q7R73_01170 [bacterium]|nr:hypothetical protein [bacterium]